MKTRGYSMTIVLASLALLAAAFSVLVAVLISSAHVTGDMKNRREAFYICDGLSRSTMTLANNYLRNIPSEQTPSAAAMKASIEAEAGGAGLPALIPASYTLERLEIDSIDASDVSIAPIPNGPFRGMNSRQTAVSFKIAATRNGSAIRCEQTAEVTLAQIAMFQFMVFSEVTVRSISGAGATFFGRVHSNSDVCLGGAGTGGANANPRSLSHGPYFDFVTSAQKFMDVDDSRCAASDSGLSANNSGGAVVADGSPSDGSTTFRSVSNNADHGCTNCGGTGNDWIDFAIARWNGRVQDEDHGVTPLQLPVAGAAEVQAGYDVRINTPVSNDNLSRFLVDPPRGADSNETKAQKYACKADIRIVDGVWYKRPSAPADGCGWPGEPIWSDHPGTWTADNGMPTTPIQTAFTGSPNMFSYYEQGSPDNTGVISYGVLRRSAGVPDASTTWAPGHYPILTPPSSSAAGPVVANATNLSSYANGTRSGFRNGHAERTASTDRFNRAKILPVNFDVANFQRALASNATGELGSYFSDVPGDPDFFNGIIYITSTWPGQSDNFGGGGNAALYPTQGTTCSSGTSSANTPNSCIAQRFLPQPLCADAGAGGFGGVPGAPGTQLTAACGNPGTGRPNALRIHNAANINRNVLGGFNGQLPLGITIATNLPFYLLGFTNNSSDVNSPSATIANGGWIPMAVAGDQAHLLSAQWDDHDSAWTDNLSAANSSINRRCAAHTTYNFAMLTGHAAASDSSNRDDGAIINLPRFLEWWHPVSPTGTVCGQTQRTATIRGSFVQGYHPVHSDHRWGDIGRQTYTFPRRNWAFDQHLDLVNNQPPGTPIFDVAAIARWKRN